ncbi:MAG: ABC transporter ATP-binding protein [Chloroflexi bacterium]|uniref:ABC transporter ATP-binding protein n=1 Tax=Candidatus Chlorohelix allophototropha TaxID=3003348 RepID=A0A8T7MAV4_9CHLR|nr:ABC transporter ATP-binding protein [Chloroflexota bacterium]
MLKIEKLNVAYGDVQVLWDVDLEVQRGEILALVGSNGAGKTTLLSTISGLLNPKSGEINFNGKNIAGKQAQEIVGNGVAHVPEGRRLFGALSVRENLQIGAYKRKDKAQIAADLEYVLSLFPRIKERLNSLAGKLSGGEQQMVAIGRGLMARPSLLMIDELSLGLAPVIIENLLEIIQTVNREGTTILIVEQDVQTALEYANRGYVLETGHVILTGTSANLLEDDRVKKAYLGL